MDYRKVRLNLVLKHEYTIDTLGVVTNITENRVLKGTSISKTNRYVKIHLDKFYPLHRLVAEHFLPNPDGHTQVNHRDGNRYNNCADNLEWCTPRHNMLHAYANGLKSNHGELNPFRKLTEEEVKLIWSLRNTKLTAKQIRDKLNLSVSVGCIKAIRQGKAWSSVTSQLA